VNNYQLAADAERHVRKELPMPKYMVLSSTFLHPEGEAGPRLVTTGEVIDFDGAPGCSLAAMDADAVAAKEAVAAGRDALGRNHDALQETRCRLGLNGSLRRRLESAEQMVQPA
jgi:hypothetical protein